MRGIAHTLAQVSRLSLPYFRSEDRWAGRGLLGAILAIELAQVGIAVLLNSWNARFYDALQHKNASAFGYELIVFCALAGIIHSARRLPALSEPRSPDSMASVDDQSFAWLVVERFHAIPHAAFCRLRRQPRPAHR